MFRFEMGQSYVGQKNVRTNSDLLECLCHSEHKFVLLPKFSKLNFFFVVLSISMPICLSVFCTTRRASKMAGEAGLFASICNKECHLRTLAHKNMVP